MARSHATGTADGDLAPDRLIVEPDASVSIDPGAGNVRGDEGDAARYRAPEVLGGDPPDPRSDVWSLGAVLLEALTGECLRGELEPRRSDLPDAFRDVLSRSLDPDPSRRFTNAGELLEALEDVG